MDRATVSGTVNRGSSPRGSAYCKVRFTYGASGWYAAQSFDSGGSYSGAMELK